MGQWRIKKKFLVTYENKNGIQKHSKRYDRGASEVICTCVKGGREE